MTNDRVKELESMCWEDVSPEWSENYKFVFNIEKFAGLIIEDCNRLKIAENMSDPSYAKAMDEYYEKKWAHRFD